MSARGRRRAWRDTRVLAACCVVAAVALTALLTAALTGTGAGAPAARTLAVGVPTLAPAADVRSFAASVGHPVWWAGPPQAGLRVELTHTADGGVYVRYLPAGVRAGDKGARFLTVGTYHRPGAYAHAVRLARRAGKRAVRRSLPGGAMAVYYRAVPSSVYVAHPGSDRLVEVFHPDPARALGLVSSGTVGQVR